MRRILIFLIISAVSDLAYSQFSPGTIGNSQSICYRYAPALLSFTTPPTGIPNFTYRWQRSNDNGLTWSDISGTTASQAVYSPPVLARTTRFRCRVADATNLPQNTNEVIITVLTDFTGGIIGDDQTVYSSTTPGLIHQLAGPSGGSGIYNYQWQSSSNGLNWSNITNATSEEYLPGSLASDRWFRRFVFDGTCGSVASNTIKISVNPITIYTTELPVNSSNEDRYSFGTEFIPLTDGYITHVRLYSHLLEGGDHFIRLWVKGTDGNYGLAEGPYTWNFSSGIQGWRVFQLPEAIPILAGVEYIISITNGPDQWYVQSNLYFEPVNQINNPYLDYRNAFFGAPDIAPGSSYSGASYFRDIIFSLFSPGSISSSQSVCYNSTPSSLMQTTMPTGGNGDYGYQWQSSADNISWSDIEGATSGEYAPPSLTTSTYFRLNVTSGNITASSLPVMIEVNSQFELAQLLDNITIFNNTATNLKVSINGGTPPYIINYERNGIPQTPVSGYYSGSDISTGVLGSGTYTYSLTSVTDAKGCPAQSLGTGITVTVSGTYSPASSNKALVVVNSSSPDYTDFTNLIKPYLDSFGIPYDLYNEPSPQNLPVLSNYALIIFGHKNVYDGSTVLYPVNLIDAAVQAGVGLYSFDPNLFNYSLGIFSTAISPLTVSSTQIDVDNTTHYITLNHATDAYNIPLQENGDVYSNNYDVLTLVAEMPASQNTILTSGTSLATMSQTGNTVTLLEISQSGYGRIVKWNEYDWAYEGFLGPIYGMDDLLWRSIVWAARKPFVMQGMPPIVTMRVDDVEGSGPFIMENFEWINICNEYGLIPWCGTFSSIPEEYMSNFRAILDNGQATAAPHAFSYDHSIYFNHDGDDGDPAVNTQTAHTYYENNGLKMSKVLIPHYYEVDLSALQWINEMGIEFIGTHMPLGQPYGGETWLPGKPYRVPDAYLHRAPSGLPVFYADYISGSGYTFFDCVAEIRDDFGYEWYPDPSNLQHTIARGVRQLTRSLNSMVLATLFTHYNYLDFTETNWRTVLTEITNAITPYNPEYRSLDYAAQYVRAKNNLSITNVSDDQSIVNITFTGNNDMDTKCYLFTESGGQITSRLVLLPMINSGTITVGVLK